MKVSGGCYCGKLRYEAEGEPLLKAMCLCRECQYGTGGGASMVMAMPRSGFRYTSGDPKTFARDDLENAVERQFCGDCGTGLVNLPPGMPDILIIRIGTLDYPAQFGAPDMAVNCVDQQPFHYMPDEMMKFERFPG